MHYIIDIKIPNKTRFIAKTEVVDMEINVKVIYNLIKRLQIASAAPINCSKGPKDP